MNATQMQRIRLPVAVRRMWPMDPSPSSGAMQLVPLLFYVRIIIKAVCRGGEEARARRGAGAGRKN